MAAAIALAVPVVGSRPASAMPATLDLVGHGWGHGRGMGQYGALGYSQAPWNWNYQQILAHYYGGTTLTSTSVPSITVHLSELDGAASINVAASPNTQLVLNGTVQSAPSLTVKPGQTVWATNNGDVVVSGPWSTGSQRSFAGQISLGASPAVVYNTLPLDQYVEGVVPRESPASWPLAALEAQAVAARSYALASTGGSGAICDTPYCQVYGGDPAQYPNSYSTNSNAAVTATAGQILVCQTSTCGSVGQPALAEYSSSTGGYTAGGAFPAVPDDGDSTPSNPNHTWTTSVAASAVQAAFPSVGTLQSVAITQRNGLGDMGGRVLQMVLAGTAGTQTITGDQFEWALGLNSDWFTITNAGAPPGSDTGYWIVGADGSVYPFGSAPSYGSMVGYHLNAPVIGMAPTGDGAGYWLVGADGGIFSFGDAAFYGSTGDRRLTSPVLGMASTRTGRGYWLVAGDGGIFSFGDARFYGSTGGVHLVRPIVAMARTGDGGGYWLVASDGGVFTFGDAHFYGSTSGIRLAAPIVGMIPTSDGGGYWLIGADGGIFSFGDAGFSGSLGGAGVADATSVSATPDDHGYLIVTRTGRVYSFGDASYFGDPASSVSGWAGTALGIFSRG
jgi:SpoIID/LytB domain protein